LDPKQEECIMKIIALSALTLALTAFGARAQDTSSSTTAVSPSAPAPSTDNTAALPGDQPKAPDSTTTTTQTTTKLPDDSSAKAGAYDDSNKSAQSTTDDSLKDSDSSAMKPKTLKRKHGQARTGSSMRHRSYKTDSSPRASDTDALGAPSTDTTTGTSAKLPSDGPAPTDSSAKSGDLSGVKPDSTTGNIGAPSTGSTGDQAVPAAPSTGTDSTALPKGSYGTAPGDSAAVPGNTTTSPSNTDPSSSKPIDSTTTPAPKAEPEKP
jgi:hypothetical protein